MKHIIDKTLYILVSFKMQESSEHCNGHYTQLKLQLINDNAKNYFLQFRLTSEHISKI